MSDSKYLGLLGGGRPNTTGVGISSLVCEAMWNGSVQTDPPTWYAFAPDNDIDTRLVETGLYVVTCELPLKVNLTARSDGRLVRVESRLSWAMRWGGTAG